jgi:hypothetical protein
MAFYPDGFIGAYPYAITTSDTSIFKDRYRFTLYSNGLCRTILDTFTTNTAGFSFGLDYKHELNQTIKKEGILTSL